MQRQRLLNSIYLASFLFTIHYAFLLYIGSTFLQQFFPAESAERTVSVIYTIGAIVTIGLLSKTPALFRRFGIGRTTRAFFWLLALSALGLSWVKDPVIIIVLFVSLSALQILIRYSLDVYVEKCSSEEMTGRLRGIFLTVINTAIALSPFLVGRIINQANFSPIYLISSGIIFFVLLITRKSLAEVPEGTYHSASLIPTIRKIWHRPNIYKILVVNLLLELFYAWMVIYTPLFLQNTLGFAWSEIGVIFSIMLIPFVLVELPAGYIADKYLGEKEMLTTGLVIMGVSTIALAYFHATTILPWAALLFITRIGAALVEIMTDTYFFKKVSVADTDIISLFRSAKPIAIVVAPFLATVILAAGTFQTLYLVLGVILLFGVRYSLTIEDTK